MDQRIRYCVELDRIRNIPDYNRIRAETHFLLLKEFEDQIEPTERKRLGKGYRKTVAAASFCDRKGISLTTFFRWSRDYKKHGIEGLVPLYGSESKAPKLKKPLAKQISVRIWVDPKNPLGCLRQLLKILKIHPAISAPVAEKAAAYLQGEIFLQERKTGLSLGRPLTMEELEALERYRSGTHKNHRAKALILLLANEGKTLLEVARASGRSPGTIYRCLRTFRTMGLTFIETKLNKAGREKIWQERKIKVIDILHGGPSLYGINRTSWSLEAIQEAYKRTHGEHLPIKALTNIIKRSGYSWRRARKVLTSPDPAYREKVARIIETLQALEPGDAFFFVDEAGPWRVKKYGGKALVQKGTVRTVPEIQLTKGAVYLIAALEALTNQVVWLFIDKKNSAAVISMLAMLRQKYSSMSRICLTWDALSSHNSEAVTGWIDEANAQSHPVGSPRLEVIPLPANAQFLNVIESVFSSLRRSVIHNSDYAAKEEMEAAIARYFDERNTYFLANPKRAGNKIWDKEIFKIEELPGGLFRKM